MGIGLSALGDNRTFGVFTLHRKGYGMAKAKNAKALLIDITRCVGCNECQNACQKQNGLPELSGDETGRLSDKAYTALRDCNGVSVRQLCRHCHEPACKSVCLVDAFKQTDEGAVLYDGNKCIGCRNCIQACPFYVPRYEWSKTFPRVKKCVLCSEMDKQGKTKQKQPTACAEACAKTFEDMGDGKEAAATMFGDYNEMVAIATKRMTGKPKSDENPDGYVQKIYGLKEVGGTTVLYLSAVPFEKLGFDTKLDKDGNPAAGFNAKLEEGDMPDRTMRALSKVPYVVGVGAVVLGGIWWITNRRHEVEKHEANNDSHNK